MKNFNLLLLMWLAAVSGMAQILSPTVVSTGGKFATASGAGSLSQTVGEMAVQKLSASSVILTQGFQQPVPDFNNSVTELSGEGAEIKLYPNPASSQLFINIRSEQNTIYQLRMMDAIGRQVAASPYSASTVGTSYVMDISGLVAGIYLLNIESFDKKFSKTIRFSKN
jgi:hypothetical protein